jgi:hypothetical protein
VKPAAYLLRLKRLLPPCGIAHVNGIRSIEGSSPRHVVGQEERDSGQVGRLRLEKKGASKKLERPGGIEDDLFLRSALWTLHFSFP